MEPKKGPMEEEMSFIPGKVWNFNGDKKGGYIPWQREDRKGTYERPGRA